MASLCDEVRSLLLSKCDSVDGAMTTKEMLKYLDPNTNRNEVNRLLYKPEMLALDRIYVLSNIRIDGKKSAPRWILNKKKNMWTKYSDEERLGWTIFEDVRHTGSTHISAYPKQIRERLEKIGREKIISVMNEFILDVSYESIEISDDWTITYENKKPVRVGFIMDCDQVIGADRGVTSCIRLGMAIQEFITKYPGGQEVVLQTKNEGLFNILRYVVKTTDAIRDYNVSVVLAKEIFNHCANVISTEDIEKTLI